MKAGSSFITAAAGRLVAALQATTARACVCVITLRGRWITVIFFQGHVMYVALFERESFV